MNTQLFMENYELDVSSDISSLITFELDNIKEFAARGTKWSKTIVLPGTSKNNKLFGGIFQIGNANSYDSSSPNVNYNFNASKSADCIIFQDQMQTFKGVLRLLQINIIKGRIEYEVAVFGELALLNVALNGGKLEDLDFSAYDHTYNVTNIVNSWDNTPGSGYYYPLIDYGTASSAKADWDIRTFRPALYVKEYIDKMFEADGFRYSSALFETDRFKRLVVPNNLKNLTSLVNDLIAATAIGNQIISPSLLDLAEFDSPPTGSGFTLSVDGKTFTYAGATGATIDIEYTFDTILTYSNLSRRTRLEILKNGTTIFSEEKYGTFNTFSGTFQTSIAISDTIEFEFTRLGTTGFGSFQIDSGSIDINSTTAVVVSTEPGDPVSLNDNLPKNIRQSDFFASIIKLFNLYVYEDRFDNRLINITPYVDFYSVNSADSIDWSYKLNRDKAIQVKPMSEINAKKYEFKYKSDGDYYNDLYRKRYSQGYGDNIFDSAFEFAEQTKGVELIFSATPLVGYSGEDKVFSTIMKISSGVEERTDSNIRILQSKKITGVTSWDIKNGATVLTSTTNYGYAGHLDDPDAPSNDLNFGALRELFFTLVSGDLSVTQFNVYWSSYMAEITDKDSKLMSAWFRLLPKDILLIDFSKKIWIDGILYRLNSIKDYNTTKQEDCKVELLKVNYLLY